MWLNAANVATTNLIHLHKSNRHVAQPFSFQAFLLIYKLFLWLLRDVRDGSTDFLRSLRLLVLEFSSARQTGVTTAVSGIPFREYDESFDF